MILNFIYAEYSERSKDGSKSYTTILSNAVDTEQNKSLYDTCCMSVLVCSMYFLLNVLPVFFDFIFGLMDVYDYKPDHPIVDMKSWLIVSGLFGYAGLILLVLITRVYRQDTFVRRMLRVFAYVINGFIVVWSGIGMTCFFSSYYNMKNYTSHNVFYNYLLIRMVLSPIISLYKFIEVSIV